MDALSEFLHMGGYAFFVWTSYGLGAVLLAANLWFAVRRDRQVRRRLRRLHGEAHHTGAGDGARSP